MSNDRDKLEKKGLTWDEFEERLNSIHKSIEKLIQDTNDTQNDR